MSDHGLGTGLDLFFVGDIHGEGSGLSARSGDLRDQFLELCLIARGHRDRSARSCQFQRAGVADALGSARD